MPHSFTLPVISFTSISWRPAPFRACVRGTDPALWELTPVSLPPNPPLPLLLPLPPPWGPRRFPMPSGPPPPHLQKGRLRQDQLRTSCTGSTGDLGLSAEDPSPAGCPGQAPHSSGAPAPQLRNQQVTLHGQGGEGKGQHGHSGSVWTVTVPHFTMSSGAKGPAVVAQVVTDPRIGP